MKIGETHQSRYGLIEVLEYRDHKNVLIRFLETGYEKVAQAADIRGGSIKDLLARSVYGVGYIGVGPWKVSSDCRQTPAYRAWAGMLARCYATNPSRKLPSYDGCEVHVGWHCFQEFADWFNRLKYKQDGWSLDKDVIHPGCKVYSPATCAMLPDEINCAMKPSGGWSPNLPEGVAYIGSGNRAKRYQAKISTFGSTQRSLGYYHTPAEAAVVHAEAKERYARQLARKWAGIVDPRAINALLSYKHAIREV